MWPFLGADTFVIFVAGVTTIVNSSVSLWYNIEIFEEWRRIFWSTPFDHIIYRTPRGLHHLEDHRVSLVPMSLQSLKPAQLFDGTTDEVGSVLGKLQRICGLLRGQFSLVS